jgi:hypothetical protein
MYLKPLLALTSLFAGSAEKTRVRIPVQAGT